MVLNDMISLCLSLSVCLSLSLSLSLSLCLSLSVFLSLPTLPPLVLHFFVSPLSALFFFLSQLHIYGFVSEEQQTSGGYTLSCVAGSQSGLPGSEPLSHSFIGYIT